MNQPEREPMTLETLAGRLARLEAGSERLRRENRVLKAALAATLLLGLFGGGAWLLPGRAADGAEAKPARVVEAERFVLVGPDGTRRAVLGIDDKWPAGEEAKKPGFRPMSGLYLRDEKGKPRLALIAGEDAGLLTFVDDAAKPALAVAVTKDREVALGVNDAKGVTRAMLGLGKDGKPLFLLRGDEALLGVNDLAGTTRVMIGHAAGQGVVVIQDKNGQRIAQLP